VDFVVVGFGIGALGVVLGFLVRDVGPWLRRVPRGGGLGRGDVARRVAWARACRAGGSVLALAGGAVCAVALLALLGGAGDRAGLVAVLVALGLALLAMLAWAGAYVRRNPRPRRAAPRAPESTWPAPPAAATGWPAPLPAPSPEVVVARSSADAETELSGAEFAARNGHEPAQVAALQTDPAPTAEVPREFDAEPAPDADAAPREAPEPGAGSELEIEPEPEVEPEPVVAAVPAAELASPDEPGQASEVATDVEPEPGGRGGAPGPDPGGDAAPVLEVEGGETAGIEAEVGEAESVPVIVGRGG
jgi:hypothetical protein